MTTLPPRVDGICGVDADDLAGSVDERASGATGRTSAAT
jgi:hypothetical protein